MLLILSQMRFTSTVSNAGRMLSPSGRPFRDISGTYVCGDTLEPVPAVRECSAELRPVRKPRSHRGCRRNAERCSQASAEGSFTFDSLDRFSVFAEPGHFPTLGSIAIHGFAAVPCLLIASVLR